MIYNDDENQYRDVKDILGKLKKVNAPMYFEADLMRRINSGEFESKIKLSFLDKLLLPARLLPSAAVAAAAIIMLFVLNTSPAEQENPFSVEPRVREDVINTGSNAGLSLDEEMKSIAEKNNNSAKSSAGSNTGLKEYYPPNQSTASFISTSSINSGLNYRQIYLTNEQKEKINHLREKFNSYFNSQAAGKK